jgi:hypothetical protein
MRGASIVRSAALGASLLSFAFVGPVAAAADNDTFPTATPVAIGDTINEDTTTADATDPDETALNEFCGAPVVEHGVWFTITPAADAFVAFDVSASDYSAGIMLFAGDPTPESLLNCGPQSITNDLTGGSTYNMLAFGDGFLTTETAGNLVFTVREAVPPPDVQLAVDKFGTADRFGGVRISGTVTCTSTDGTGQVVEVFGDIRQRVGRIFITGFFDEGLSVPCDGTPQRWQAFAFSDNGIFAGGKAATLTIGVGCTDFCNEGFTEATIQLRRAKQH